MAPHDMLIYEHGDIGLNIAHYRTGDTMIDKTLFRSEYEAETGEGIDYFIRVFSNSDYDDIFDEIALPHDTEEDIYYTNMSLLLSHIISGLGKKNIIIIDLTCSTFEDKPATNELITERIQRNAGRKLVKLGLWGGKKKRRHYKTRKYKRKSNKRITKSNRRLGKSHKMKKGGSHIVRHTRNKK